MVARSGKCFKFHEHIALDMSAQLEKAIFFMVETYLTSGIVTRRQALQVLENVRNRIGEYRMRE